MTSDLSQEAFNSPTIEAIEKEILKTFKKGIVGYCTDGRIFKGLQPLYDHMYKGVKVTANNKRKRKSTPKASKSQALSNLCCS